MSKYPYISEEYQKLVNGSFSSSDGSQDVPNSANNLSNSHGQINNNNKSNYFQTYGTLPYKYNHDSYAADEPNPQVYNMTEKSNHSQTPGSDLQNSIDKLKEIIHKVQHHDTLEGLSLTYDVSITKIKQRNNIDGDSIYYLKEIIIPNPATGPLQNARTKQMIIQQFVAHMPFEQKSSKTAQYYLQENNWDFDEAIKSFKSDLDWERNNKIFIKSTPAFQNNSKGYNQIQLSIKKNS